MKLKWWIVPVVVAVMLLASWGMAKTIRFPTQVVTTKVRLADPDVDLQTVEFRVQNLKCWTMSGLFTEMMSQEEGVIEVKTYVRTHSAVVTYDPGGTSVNQLTERINSPVLNPETGQHMSVFRVESVSQ